MDLNAKKEAFSRAYVQAVASVAGYRISVPIPDDDSVDITFSARGPCGTVRSPKLDAQLKCTSARVDGDSFKFQLKLKNYEDLRHDDFQVPRILIVILVPEESCEWAVQTHESMVMKRAGFWISLRGWQAVSHQPDSKVAIEIPTSQLFTPEALKRMMERIQGGGLP